MRKIMALIDSCFWVSNNNAFLRNEVALGYYQGRTPLETIAMYNCLLLSVFVGATIAHCIFMVNLGRAGAGAKFLSSALFQPST